MGAGELGFLSGLPAVSAAEANSVKGAVRLRAEIEPVVRLLEETPRERLLEEVGARVKATLRRMKLGHEGDIYYSQKFVIDEDAAAPEGQPS